MGQIIDKGPNKHLLRVNLGRDGSGKRKVVSKLFEGTIAQAKKELTKMEADRNNGSLVQPSKMTVKEYIEGWLSTKSDCEQSTIQSYRHTVELYVFPQIGGLRLSQVSPLHIRTLYGALNDKGLSARTVRYTHTVLNMALGMAEEDRLIQENPCGKKSARQALPKAKKDGSAGTALSADDIAKVLNGEKNAQYRVMWDLLLVTALRAQEIQALKWSDLSDTGWFHIRRTVQHVEKGREVVVERTKTDEHRQIPLDEDTLVHLKRHRTEQSRAMLAAGPTFVRQDYIFTRDNGDFLGISTIRNAWKRALARVGVKAVRLYDTRHTSLTHQVATGADPKVIAERAGHSVGRLMSTYVHPSKETAQKLANDTARAIRSGTLG